MCTYIYRCGNVSGPVVRRGVLEVREGTTVTSRERGGQG